LYLQVRL